MPKGTDFKSVPSKHAYEQEIRFRWRRLPQPTPNTVSMRSSALVRFSVLVAKDRRK
jgi:hypothetical protein